MLSFPMPWSSFAEAEPATEYVVMASRLPLRRFWKLPAFFRMTMAIRKQLAVSEGLIGYSLLARPFAKEFLTLSAWRSQEDLNAFVRTLPHAKVMTDLRPHMAPTTFVFWRLPGSALPPAWDDATARIADASAAT